MAKLGQAANVILVQVGEDRDSHIGDVETGGRELTRERVAFGDVEAGESRVYCAEGPARKVAGIGDGCPTS